MDDYLEYLRSEGSTDSPLVSWFSEKKNNFKSVMKGVSHCGLI